jgi:hypothetical protein
MNRFSAQGLVTLTLVISACSDSVSAPTPAGQLSLAKGGPTSENVDFTITDAGMSVVSDGKGTYRNGVCGVLGTWSSDVLFLAPAGSSVPKSQKVACAGIAPRGATLNLTVRHVSDDPHVDDDQAPAGHGSYAVQNIKFGFGPAGASTVNAAGSCGSIGLRFSPITYPGSDDLIRDDLGGGRWHMYSRPWPDDVAYCDNGTSVTFWHVAVDLYVQVVGS